MNKEMTATNYETNSGLENKSVTKNHYTHTGNPTSGNNQQQQQNNTLIMSTVASSAFIAPNSPSSSSSTSKNNGDSTFEPTVDMMVNDFDDEQTLEEEEALAAQEFEDASAELSNLQKESDMPIEELLALYNCNGAIVGSSEKRAKNSSYLKKKLKPQRTTSSSSSNCEGSDGRNITDGDQNVQEEDEEIGEEDDEDDDDNDDDNLKDSQLRKLYPETYGNSNDKRLLRTISRQQSDEEDDGEYSSDEDEFKKTIMVGSEFQAVIPEGFLKYDDVLPYENEDKLLWDPSRLNEKQTEEYLQRVKALNVTTNGDIIPYGNHLRDDEQALYLLLQCGHNTEEALRRKRLNVVPLSSDEMSIWSEEECRNFESGIRIYGKDFYTIKHTKVRTRSVGELVQFYYLWKKTERHDVFANKARLEKKKYSLHPGLTDYMDRFLEEQESNNGVNITNTTIMNPRDRSSSPAINNCILQADTKHQNLKIHHSSSSLNTDSSAINAENGGTNNSGNSNNFINASKIREQENNSSTTTINIGIATSSNKLHSLSSLPLSNQAEDAGINNTR